MLIGRLARLSGLSKDGIRHYEEIGLIRSTERRAGGRIYRDYDADALGRIEAVRQAQRLGLSLREIAPLLQAHAGGRITRAETVAFLRERRAAIRARIAELAEIERFIDSKLERYGAGQPPSRPPDAAPVGRSDPRPA